MGSMLVPAPDGVHWSAERLTPETVPLAASLCDRCVGENLYPRTYLLDICGRPEHYFFLIRSPEGTAEGYFYFHLTDRDGMAEFLRWPRAGTAGLCGPETVVANLRSVGLTDARRGTNLSAEMMGYFLQMLRTELHAGLAFCVCWKPNGTLPTGNILRAYRFRHLADIPRFWEDVPDLNCPVCGGPCRCDAAVYYIRLKEDHP